MNESIRYHVLKQIQDNPEITQRELAGITGVSLGKLNYCLKALVDKGYIKAVNFKNSRQKSAYLYMLTPRGIEEKALVTGRFLKRKMAEYDRIKAEIEELRQEAGKLS
jgi:EPS-associated MarR family transcriptional regulator